MKILFLTNIPSPYMVDFLNELGKLCELTVVFEREKANGRDASWEAYTFKTFQGIILRGIPLKISDELDDQAIAPQVIKYLKKRQYHYIIVANPCTPTGIIAIEYMKLRKMEYLIQSEGGFAKDGKGVKEKFKKHIMQNAKAYFSTTEIGDNYFLQYGARKENILRFPFTTLYEKEILDRPLALEEKRALREKNDIYYQKLIISVGRFLPVKRFEVYIEACSCVDKSVGILLIGGEPTKQYLQMQKKYNLENLHFLPFFTKEKLREYYLMADMLVFTSENDTWGLVINEAMSLGLPIICSTGVVAGHALVEDNVNGYLVQTDNVDAFQEKILHLLDNPKLCEKISKNNIEKMKTYTIEEMAKNHILQLNKLNGK